MAVSQIPTTSEVVFLSRRDVETLLSINEVIEAVEHAFKLEAENETIMPPKIYLDLPVYRGDFRAMPAYIDGLAGMKWVSVYPGNREYNLPSVLASIILNDPITGQLLAVMDGTYITEMRTGAAGGVAVKHLARNNSSIIGFIGAGVQAKTQLLAIREILADIQHVYVYDMHKDKSLHFAEEMGNELGLNISVVNSLCDATTVDILVTTTPATTPIIPYDCIKPGTHINAIGADASGKQELDPLILINGKIIVDDVEQAAHSGEINVPLKQGLLGESDIYSTLGQIIAGINKGRSSDEDTTIFDSTGLAILDIMCAGLAYKKYIYKHDTEETID